MQKNDIKQVTNTANKNHKLHQKLQQNETSRKHNDENKAKNNQGTPNGMK